MQPRLSVRDRRKMQQNNQRQRYVDRTLDRDTRNAQARRATVAGYDAETGRVRVRLAGANSGSEILAESISNGAIERGAMVAVQTTRGSSRVAVDAMPR